MRQSSKGTKLCWADCKKGEWGCRGQRAIDEGWRRGEVGGGVLLGSSPPEMTGSRQWMAIFSWLEEKVYRARETKFNNTRCESVNSTVQRSQSWGQFIHPWPYKPSFTHPVYQQTAKLLNISHSLIKAWQEDWGCFLSLRQVLCSIYVSDDCQESSNCLNM